MNSATTIFVFTLALSVDSDHQTHYRGGARC